MNDRDEKKRKVREYIFIDFLIRAETAGIIRMLQALAEREEFDFFVEYSEELISRFEGLQDIIVNGADKKGISEDDLRLFMTEESVKDRVKSIKSASDNIDKHIELLKINRGSRNAH